MFSILLILVCHVFLNEGAILHCDFESACDDFVLDTNWGLTDGDHPQSINYDHTFNISSGHYLFYNPPPDPRFRVAEIKTKNWLEVSTDRAICFRMWYYTPQSKLPFNIQLIQGDDERLTRIAVSIAGKDPLLNDWTLVNVTLPNEKMKLVIRVNVTTRSLVFDDMSIDYCDGPRPMSPKVLYQCDFETSSCSDDFQSLPNYPYQWTIQRANHSIQIEPNSPSIDYTFGNQSGHYALVTNPTSIAKGNVGYLHLQKKLNITLKESYCLHFQYYVYQRSLGANLNVYLRTTNQSDVIQTLWPIRNTAQYIYTSNKWTWGTINLPVGQYTLLFRVDTIDIFASMFALDNIIITSCSYSPSEQTPYYNLLSFSCNFDNWTMCNMINEVRFAKPTANYTVFTGETIPYRELGPIRDHTSNSTLGGFLYWNRQSIFTARDSGRIYLSRSIEQNFGMCIQFAYYVKSLAMNINATTLSISLGGCYATILWVRKLDDSQGWQTATIPVSNFACAETFYFDVNHIQTIPVSVAFDDIIIHQCNSLSSITSTSPTTPIVITSSTTYRTSTVKTSMSVITSASTSSTTPIVATSSSIYRTSTVSTTMPLIPSTLPSTLIETTMLPVTSTLKQITSTTTTDHSLSSTFNSVSTIPNNAHWLISSNGHYFLMIYFLFQIVFN